MRNLYKKYPVLISALLLVFFSFPDVIIGNSSLMITDAAPFDGSSAYVTADGHKKNRALYYQLNSNTTQGFFDAGGSIWQSESKIPFMRDVIKNGESPFWNSYQGAGTLGPETLVDTKFSPLTMISALLGGGAFAYSLTVILLLTLSSYCLIKFCVDLLSLPLIAGIGAGMAFIFNGFNTSGLAANYSQSYLLFPLVLYTLCAWVKYGTLARFIAAYISCALVLCITFLPTTALVLLTACALAAAYVLEQPYSYKKKLWKIATIGLVPLLGLALTACLYLPIAQALSENKELGVYSARVFYPVMLNGLISLLSPKHLWNSYVTMDNFLLSAADSPAFVGNNTIFHVGVIAALFAIFTFQKSFWKRPVLIFAWLASGLMLLRVFGVALYPHPENPAFSGNIILRIILLTALVYGLYSQKNNWKNLAFLPVWLLSILLALRLLGLSYYDQLFDSLPMVGSFGTQYIWATIMICLPIIVAYGISNLKENPALLSRAKYLLGFILLLLITLLPYYPLDIIRKTNIWYMAVLLFLCGLIYLIYKKQKRGSTLKYLPLMLLSLLFVEYNFYVNHSRTERSDLYRENPDYVAYLKQNTTYERLLNIGQIGIPAEQASAYGLYDISTMTNSAPPDYIDFYMKYLVAKENIFFNILTNLQAKDNALMNQKMVSFMGVKHIVVQKDWPVWNKFLEENMTLVFSSKSVAVYENKNAWPRAFFTNKPLEQLTPESIDNDTITRNDVIAAEITSYHHDHLTISVTAPESGTLVLTDNWYPYWQAKLGGNEVKIDKVFGAFRGVAVPQGAHTIEFSYVNPAVLTGLKISKTMMIITLILSLAAFIRFRFESKKPSVNTRNSKLSGQI